MAKYEGQDHYLDPATGVLQNRLGISDEAELKAAEASLVAWRTYQLVERPVQGRLDLDHLKAIHRHLFQDVYEWAGELRDIDLARDNSYFANHLHIIEAARLIFAKSGEGGLSERIGPCRLQRSCGLLSRGDQCPASFP